MATLGEHLAKHQPGTCSLQMSALTNVDIAACVRCLSLSCHSLASFSVCIDAQGNSAYRQVGATRPLSGTAVDHKPTPDTMPIERLRQCVDARFFEAYVRAGEAKTRLPPPPTPGCACLAHFGKTLGWRTGDAAADAAAAELTTRALREQQVTPCIIAQWALFYVNEKRRNVRNPSAAGRARFLINALRLLDT
jgi:hypothetical protein